MTDATKPQPQPENDAPTGVKRPDQGGTNTPGKTEGAPASGGDGAKGAGGSKGFGTGS